MSDHDDQGAVEPESALPLMTTFGGQLATHFPLVPVLVHPAEGSATLPSMTGLFVQVAGKEPISIEPVCDPDVESFSVSLQRWPHFNRITSPGDKVRLDKEARLRHGPSVADWNEERPELVSRPRTAST